MSSKKVESVVDYSSAEFSDDEVPEIPLPAPREAPASQQTQPRPTGSSVPPPQLSAGLCFSSGELFEEKGPIFVYLHRLLLLGVQPVVLPPVQSEVPLPVLHSGGSYVSPVQPDISDAVPWAAGGSGAFGQYFRPAVRFSLPAAVRPGQPGSSGRDPRRRHQPAQTQGNIKKLDFYLLVFTLS